MKAIGMLKTKVTVYCEICNCSHVRNVSENIYENTEEEKERAKISIRNKAAKKYTCSICKSIIKG